MSQQDGCWPVKHQGYWRLQLLLVIRLIPRDRKVEQWNLEISVFLGDLSSPVLSRCFLLFQTSTTYRVSTPVSCHSLSSQRPSGWTQRRIWAIRGPSTSDGPQLRNSVNFPVPAAPQLSKVSTLLIRLPMQGLQPILITSAPPTNRCRNAIGCY
jgi:hypothetical protein